jgi:DNA-binding Lrp family transcriptional regulator
LKAYVLVQTESRGASLAPALSSIPGVVSAEDLSGAFDAIVLAAAASTRQLMEDVVAAIRRIPGVTRALPAPLLRPPAQRHDAGPATPEPDSGDRAA